MKYITVEITPTYRRLIFPRPPLAGGIQWRAGEMGWSDGWAWKQSEITYVYGVARTNRNKHRG